MVISPPFNNLHLLFPNKIFIFLFQTFIFDYSFHHPLLCFSRKFRPRKSDPNLPPSPLVDLVFSRNFENVSSFNGSTFKQKVGLVCHCGVESPLVTAWTDENPGRRFHGCGRFFLRRKCNFFRWFDPEVPDRQKKIIRGLLKKNNELKKKEKSLFKVIVI